MDYGIFIENHLELIRFDNNHNIKHFVESRKKEMYENHTKQEFFDKLYFAIDNVILIYKKYDKVELTNSDRLIYTKSFENIQKINIRIIMDSVHNRFEICSIHFQKHK